MSNELLSPAEMAEADRLAIAAGPLDGIGLMRRAGEAVAAVVLARYPAATRVHVLVSTSPDLLGSLCARRNWKAFVE